MSSSPAPAPTKRKKQTQVSPPRASPSRQISQAPPSQSPPPAPTKRKKQPQVSPRASPPRQISQSPPRDTYDSPPTSPSQRAFPRTHTKIFENKKDFDREKLNSQALEIIDISRKHFLYGTSFNYPLIEMPYGGIDMLRMIRENQGVDFKTVINWLIQIADAITILGINRFVHQDVRMPNIVISGSQARLIDFNIMVQPKTTGNDVDDPLYNISKDIIYDIAMSPYYPPCEYYYKLPEDFIRYLKHFSCYDLRGSGELYKLYLYVHGLAGKKALLEKIVPIWKKQYDRIHTDGYSLGIIMMECYILLQNVQHSKQASVYLEVAKGLTDVNNPMSTASASQRLQEIYAITTGGRKPRCVKRTNKKC